MSKTIERPPLDLQALVLKSGGHDTPEEGMCVMEAVAYFAGKPFSDHPECVCPVIGAFLRRWNDDLDDSGRQRLKRFIPLVIGTRSTPEIEGKRAWLATDWMVRVHTPAWLRLAGLEEQAATLEGLPAILSAAPARAHQAAIQEARSSAYAAWAAAWAAAGAAAWAAAGAAAGAAAWDAAWDAARAAAGAAAWDAAWAAARAAAGAAAWDAARAAARAAAWAAAWDAARDAAWDAARAAAGAAAWDAAWAAARAAAWAAAWDAARAAAGAAASKKLEPTKLSLQTSAEQLLDAMIACRD